jgi:hypothetical protein
MTYTCTEGFHPLYETTVTRTVAGKWPKFITQRYILLPRYTPGNVTDGHRPLYCFQRLLSSCTIRIGNLCALKALILQKAKGGGAYTKLSNDLHHFSNNKKSRAPRRVNTRWFKYYRDYLCVNKSQFVPVIFEPPSINFQHSYVL